MLSVSAQWHNASRSQFRYQAYLYASLEVVPPGLRNGAQVSSSDTHAQASVEKIMDGLYNAPTHYATLERNRWLLDGTFQIIESTDTFDDWWSKNAVSESQPVIKVSLDKPYTIPGMYFRWDKENNTCPKSIRVIGYDSSKVATYTVEVDDITSAEGFYETLAMNDIQYVDIEILSWMSDGWRARLLEVMFGLVVDFDSVNNGRIVSAKKKDKADPLNSKLPTHNLELVLRNYDKYFDATLQQGVSKYLAQQQVMKIQWAFITSKGVTEYAPKQVYLTEKIEIPADSKEVKMELTNRLELLDGDFYFNTYTGSSRTLRAIAEYVLTNSGALTEFDGQDPWVIPSLFDSITTVAPIPFGATNAVLQLIALAGCTWLTTRSTDGFIQFLESQVSASEYCSVTVDQELGDPEITIHDRLRSVSVGVYHYVPRSSAETVGTGEYTLSGVNVLRIKYNTDYATGVSATVSGATLTSAQYYASYAILTVTASDSGATVTVTLSGTVIDSTVSYIETYRNISIADGMDVTIENPLITNTAHAQQVAEYVKNYYLRRNEYKISYLGYPQVEAGDKIDLSTVYGADVVEVKNNTIEFNGGWSGTMEVI